MNTSTKIVPSGDESSSSGSRPTRSFVRYFPAIVRVLLGLSLLVFGLNGFFNFIPPPPTPLPEKAMAFAGALVNSGYMMPLIAITQLIVGVMLVTNRFVPLALALFAPFMVNSVAFHLFLEPSGRIISGIFMALELYLAWSYRHAFRPMLAARTTPAE